MLDNRVAELGAFDFVEDHIVRVLSLRGRNSKQSPGIKSKLVRGDCFASLAMTLLTQVATYLPKEVDATSEHKQSDFDFKTFGSDGMERFW